MTQKKFIESPLNLMSDAALLDWLVAVKDREMDKPTALEQRICIQLLKHTLKLIAQRQFPFYCSLSKLGWLEIDLSNLYDVQTNQTAALWGGRLSSLEMMRGFDSLGLLQTDEGGFTLSMGLSNDGLHEGDMVLINLERAAGLIRAHSSDMNGALLAKPAQ